jgi:calcineurin-like phosphoesterase family protein
LSIFFTADTHFGHNKIIEYCDRPFASIDEHDNALIARWNAAVSPDDTVFHLGDLSFLPRERTEEILEQLNGRIEMVLGNHDFYKRHNRPGYETPVAVWFPHIHNRSWVVDVSPATRYELVHRPEDALGVTHVVLCGHVHEKWKTRTVYRVGGDYTVINVGVDQWGYAPVSTEQLEAVLNEAG